MAADAGKAGLPWPCEAYSPNGPQLGGTCFVQDRNNGSCKSAGQCHEIITGQREQIFARLQRLAKKTSDPFWVETAERITSPDQIFFNEDCELPW